MAKEVLKDRLGNRIGDVETSSDGTQILHDRLGNRLGEYSPRDNVTRDKLGNRIGTGNLIITLLRP